MIRWRFLALITWSILLSGWSTVTAEDKPLDVKSQDRISRRMRQFFREGYRPPRQIDEESRKMRFLVNKLNSMSLSREKLQQMQDAEKPEKKIDPVVITQPVPEVKLIPKKPKLLLSKKLLRKIRKQAGEEIANPIRLADALYESGHNVEAYNIYNISLQQDLSANDDSWVMFQMANCQIKIKPIEARKLLQKLMTKHPDSPWSILAKNQELILQWCYEYEPEKVLKESRDILNEKIEQRKKALSRTDGQTGGTGQGP